MEQENDFLKREVQKLTMAIAKLIGETISADINNFETVVSESDEKLDGYFGLSLKEISKTKDSELMEKVKNIHEVHLEKLIELMFQTIQKSEEFNAQLNIEINELSKKLLLMIDFANEKSNSFSVERMNMKTKIIKLKNSNKE
eukprot:GDKH01020167.1.p1 GENE.GDKH01020167.1~~GDKH01020167.1.p1  ORF type:complete len:143 (+),score=24.42 GDKH01020167.1:401-829(+)